MTEAQHKLRVRWVSDWTSMQALRESWRDLSLRAPDNLGFFASWDYVRAYIQAVQPKNWRLAAVFDADDRLVGVFPLQLFQMQHGQQTWRACQTLGGLYATYIECPVHGHLRREVAQVVLLALKQLEIDVLVLWPLHERSWLYLALLEDMGGKPALMNLRFPGNLHEIDAQGQSLEAYFDVRKSSTLKNARYKQRRLSREGEVSVTLNETSDLDALTRQLCEWNRQRFGEQHLFGDFERWTGLISDLVQSLQPAGEAQVSTLRLSGQVIASALSYRQKRRRYFNLYAFDPAFAQFASSKILLSHLIEDTFMAGDEFCFGLGEYAYKRDWAQTVGEVKAAVVFFRPEVRASLEPVVDYKLLRKIASA